MLMSSTPWDIYAKQLFPLGYGHPLWIPEPKDHEVTIGDVGWLEEGGFHALFNSMKPKDDPINAKKIVPDDFVVFRPSNVWIEPCDKIQQQFVCSRSIHTVDAQADMAGGGSLPVSGGAGLKFQTTADAGAFVLLQVPGRSEDIKSKRHIVNYMNDSFRSWVEIANSQERWGLDLKDEDIVFISGTTKTAKWAVVAFQNNSFKKKEGHVSGDFGPFANVGFSVNISDTVLSAHHYRTGPSVSSGPVNPSRPAIAHPNHPDPSPNDPSLNQCIFVHYFKMKRRLMLKKPMQAAAGPHQLPPGPDTPDTDAIDAGGSPQYEFERENVPGRESYDPVNHLLEYILLYSDAACAIASDLDLIAVFSGGDFPMNDIPAAIARVSPMIEVDERGVGTVSVDFQFSRARRLELEGEANLATQSALQLPSLDHSALDIPAVPQHQIQPEYLGDWEGDPAQRDSSSQDPPSQHYDIPEELSYPTHDSPSSNAAGLPHEGDDSVSVGPGEGRVVKRPEIGALLSVHEGSVNVITYSADGKYAASGSEDTSIIIWDVRRNTVLHKIVRLADTVSSLAFSRHNHILASATHDEDLVLWHVRSGEEFRRMHCDPPVHTVAYTPNGKHLVGGGNDGTIHMWDVETYEERTITEKNVDVISFILFSPDGKLMATGGTENVCCIWEMANLAAGEPKSLLQGHDGMLCAAAWAPDSRRIVTASEDSSSRIWNAETGEALVILHEHTGPIWAVAFSPDGKRVASGSSDSTVKVCDSFTGERILSLEGHDSMINAVDFSSDGKFIASASSDNTVRLWNAENGASIANFNEHNDNVTTAMFSSDGSTLMSGSHDGTVYIRPLGQFT